jgi:mono/diheme cytochrome c family protein
MKSVVKSLIVTGTVIACLGTSAWAADAAAGQGVYDKKCKTCHGPMGEGNPGMAKVLATTITPLGSDEVQKMSDADLKKVVTQGKGKMKPVAGLSDADLDNVVAHVRTLKK